MDTAPMDKAAAAAMVELAEALVDRQGGKLSDNVLVPGVQWVAQWIDKHYSQAGYKRLCKGLRTFKHLSPPADGHGGTT